MARHLTALTLIMAFALSGQLAAACKVYYVGSRDNAILNTCAEMLKGKVTVVSHKDKEILVGGVTYKSMKELYEKYELLTGSFLVFDDELFVLKVDELKVRAYHDILRYAIKYADSQAYKSTGFGNYLPIGLQQAWQMTSMLVSHKDVVDAVVVKRGGKEVKANIILLTNDSSKRVQKAAVKESEHYKKEYGSVVCDIDDVKIEKAPRKITTFPTYIVKMPGKCLIYTGYLPPFVLEALSGLNISPTQKNKISSKSKKTRYDYYVYDRDMPMGERDS